MYVETKIDLLFDEPSHVYTRADTGEAFTSVTTVIGKYDQKFDDRYWAMWTALKNANIKIKYSKTNIANNKINVNGINTSLDSLYNNPLFSSLVVTTKKDWKDKTDKSHVRGNKIHNYLEDTINESRGDKFATDNEKINPILSTKAKDTGLVIFETVNDLDKTDLQDKYPSIYLHLCGFIDQGCTIIAEKKLYTTQYMIAGMIDVLVVKGKQFAIVDWKSNKDEMKFISGYFPKIKTAKGWVKGTEFKRLDDRLKAPLGNLPKCKGTIYSLQLSLYAYIMELWGYKLIGGGLSIFHIRPRRKPKLIKIPYLKEDVRRMLENFNYKRNQDKTDTKPKLRGFGISR